MCSIQSCPTLTPVKCPSTKNSSYLPFFTTLPNPSKIMNDFVFSGNIFNKQLVKDIRNIITDNSLQNPYMWAHNSENVNIFNELPVKQRYKLCMNFGDQLLKRFSFFWECTDHYFIVKIVPLLKFLKLKLV